ncbi:unnamed protein product [Prorocentrum cordatum]|uniref:Selenoprotein O n=1 Tax=Prorocentrum cordatum TaxID=2364126 RepID=A0ABN9PUM9_9DINO|nr:unnamed protein product [Polarella glacialis]
MRGWSGTRVTVGTRVKKILGSGGPLGPRSLLVRHGLGLPSDVDRDSAHDDAHDDDPHEEDKITESCISATRLQGQTPSEVQSPFTRVRLLGPVPAGRAVLSVNGRVHGPFKPAAPGEDAPLDRSAVALAEDIELAFGHRLGGPSGRKAPDAEDAWPAAAAVASLQAAGAGDDSIVLAYALAVRGLAMEQATWGRPSAVRWCLSGCAFFSRSGGLDGAQCGG